YFYFDLGSSFWRMLAAFVVAGIILSAFRLVLHAIGLAWIHFAAPRLPTGIAIIVGVLGALALAFLFIYAVVRLVFLLAAVVVAEERIGLGRAWSLGGGNFWRSVVSLIAVLLPAIIVFGCLHAALLFATMRAFPMPPFAGEDHPPPREMIAYVNKVIPFV